MRTPYLGVRDNERDIDGTDRSDGEAPLDRKFRSGLRQNYRDIWGELSRHAGNRLNQVSLDVEFDIISTSN